MRRVSSLLLLLLCLPITLADPCVGPALHVTPEQRHVRIEAGVVALDALEDAQRACLVRLAEDVDVTRGAIVLTPGVEQFLHEALENTAQMLTLANFGAAVEIRHNGRLVEPLRVSDATVALLYLPGDLLSVRSLDERMALPLTALPLLDEEPPAIARERVLFADVSMLARSNTEGLAGFATPELALGAAGLLAVDVELELSPGFDLTSSGFAELAVRTGGQSATLAVQRARDVVGDPTRVVLRASIPLAALGAPKSVSVAARVADAQSEPQATVRRFDVVVLDTTGVARLGFAPFAPSLVEPEDLDEKESGLASAAEPEPEIDPEIEASIDSETRATGLRPPTPAEEQWMQENMVPTGRVRFNELGLRRLDEAGIPRSRDLRPVAVGEEVLSANAILMTIQSDEIPVGLPVAVDNSTLDAFPPIDTQGSQGSCAAFSSTYYVMTHMHCLARGCNAKTGGRAVQFSPAFTYNLINGGEDAGSWFSSAYSVMKSHGSPTWSEFSYQPWGSDSLRYRRWPTDFVTWRAALDRRIEATGTIYSVNSASGLEQLKQLLVNGYVLNYATYVNSWYYGNIDDDPSTPDDDAFVGEQIVSHVAGTSGAHGMTVVGYDDRIWLDLNGNGTVDAGEKGALRIANSWGYWKDAGFTWIAYDALNPTSAVSGAPSPSNRDGAFWYEQAYWITARSSYEPTAVAEVTLSHAQRNQVYLSLGQGAPGSMTIDEWLYPWGPNGDGGAYAFDGTSGSSVRATFAIDFTDLAEEDVDRSWFVRLRDSVAGSALDIEGFALHDQLGRRVLRSASVPLQIDGESVEIKLEHTLDATPSAALVAGESLTSWLEPAELAHEQCAIFEISLPCGAGMLDIEVTGLDGDADLVVVHETQGSPCQVTDVTACHADHLGSLDENCQIYLPRPGRWYAAVRNVDVSQIDFSITAGVVDTTTPPPITDLRLSLDDAVAPLDLSWTRPGSCGTRAPATGYSIHETPWAPADGVPSFPSASDSFDTSDEAVMRSLSDSPVPSAGEVHLLTVIAENGAGAGEALP